MESANWLLLLHIIRQMEWSKLIRYNPTNKWMRFNQGHAFAHLMRICCAKRMVHVSTIKHIANNISIKEVCCWKHGWLRMKCATSWKCTITLLHTCYNTEQMIMIQQYDCVKYTDYMILLYTVRRTQSGLSNPVIHWQHKATEIRLQTNKQYNHKKNSTQPKLLQFSFQTIFCGMHIE